ncbi:MULTISPECIES: hypothetical protein [unclassified Mesorhizobium]|uniref:hypothetical protein n=1 Tax=unclassified Mesorhizobium TaxID=325217 RepID=UPI000FCBD388|nr:MULTISPECIES: hypothetical protein [unclassified Mesorhizobium]TGP26298.1 hypothetical protein EN874_001020 [Mesorhizobium sp. M1D.F.Ca.ET.231.01.1.1]TGP38256.1 hypothetical protein EN877_01020 [Mesorhizobium sp. M1D.F.Ca.ET.234.01.1.1]TGS50467.1 hypothetical protein EN827_01020 [Mesorhizobium sp. M1D.F.Ca.ET.184.01.1.1]TGS66353.1 hypothetical protein EN826_001020 [Mesorhizobium sp. M1D.F.Ca.ET.183.01.1.1]
MDNIVQASVIKARRGERPAGPERFAQMLRRRFNRTCLSPLDLAVCERVFNQVCADEQLDPLDPDAEILAVLVVAIFRNAHTNERELLEAVKARRQLTTTAARMPKITN